MKKRALCALLCAASMVFPINIGAAQQINVEIDGELVAFGSQRPVVVESRTLVPLRGVFEKMGYTISWEARTKVITLADHNDVIRFEIGARKYEYNGVKYELEVPAQIINSSTMLPLRAVSEATGSKVEWEPKTKLIKITTPKEQNNTDEYDDFVDGYTAIVNSLSSVDTLMNEMYGITEDNINQMLPKLKTKTNNAKISLNLAKTKLDALKTPATFRDFKLLVKDSLDSMYDLLSVMEEVYNQNLTEAKATEKIQAALKAAEANNSAVAQATRGLAIR